MFSMRNSMKTAALAAIASVAVAGAVAAGDVMRLSDAQLDGVTAGGMVDFNTNVVKNVNILKTVDLNVNKEVNSTVNISGNLATAEGSADSVGFANNLAETDTFAQVQPGGAFSFSELLAAGTGIILNGGL